MSTATERPSMLMTVADVQAETRLARSFVYRLIEEGRLPAVRVGRAVRIRRVDLERFIDERLEGGGDA